VNQTFDLANGWTVSVSPEGMLRSWSVAAWPTADVQPPMREWHQWRGYSDRRVHGVQELVEVIGELSRLPPTKET
jgi:hypothetical protein